MNDVNKPINLDRMAAQYAQQIVRLALVKSNGDGDGQPASERATAVDNTVTKALGVLQENGIYASGLFLLSRKEDTAAIIMGQMLDLLESIGNEMHFGWAKKPDPGNPEHVLKYLSDNVVVNLEQLLLTKETLEQMLIYARYGAKAANAGRANQ